MTTDRRKAIELRKAEGRSVAEAKIKALLRKNVGRWLTIREITDAFATHWHVRNCAAWVTYLRRQKKPWLVAEQRPTGRIHSITKKPIIVWSYRLADSEFESDFLSGLGEIDQ